jgi:hypothetical protein
LRRSLLGGVAYVVREVLGAIIGVNSGHRSECGLLERYVHRQRHFMVDASFGRVWPRRSLADLGAYGRAVRWLVSSRSLSQSREASFFLLQL